ncbi:MAG: alanine--tRNA ligase, partial [Nitrososphaerota archaeon]
MRFDPDEYRLEYFLENGFQRRACSVCGDFFWTLDESKTVCNEAPCVNYDFMLRRYTARVLSVADARRDFIRFFEERGHKPVRPYPLVARWRTDLFLTDASIVAFQPWVTDGIAPPPANPLVISQPCARLVDLDKVGLTFGRHLTVFEMGGHHAFNYPDHHVYWKSETAAYCQEFMTRVIGVEPQEITYKEAWWAGGGNEGPCLEVISGGLEVATLVFMKFKTVDGGRMETPVKTVDTGYGIERLAWFSNGTPSAFETIYKGIIWDVANILGVERPPHQLLREYALYTGQVIPKSDATTAEMRRRIASLTGLSLEDIRNFIEPYEKACSVLDFTKAISFILAEGIVPSNVRAGYLVRLLIRRTYRLLRHFGSEERFPDLLNLQLDYWARDFPHLADMKNEVLELVGHEIGKFRDTLAKGSEYILREVRELKKRGGRITPERLVSLYDEKGITPDIVSEIASSEDLEVEIPENFYELVASRHLREAPQATVRAGETISLINYPKTEKLYYESPWSFSFKARVLGVEAGFIILESTLFYPESGGQVGDTGELIFDGKGCRIVDTQQLGEVILHRYEGEPPRVGEIVEGLVDRERRLSIVRHHTATHILIGTVRRVLGKHAWQAGAKKDAEMGRLDIYHHKRLTDEDVRMIEEVANSVVSRKVPVKIFWRERNEAEQEYGFSLYQGGEVPLGTIRVVEIPGWDAEACGGLHCETTEDVGLIKIIRSERIQDGIERLIFTAGPASLKNIQRTESLLAEVAASLGSPLDDVPRRVAELGEEVKVLRKKMKRLREEIIPLKAVEIRQVGVSIGDLTVYTAEEEDEDQDYIIQLAGEVVKAQSPAVSPV